MPRRPLRRVAAAVATAALVMVAGCSGGGDQADGPVTLTWFMGAGVADDIATAESLAAAFNAQNPDVQVVVDASGPEGTELDQMVKTLLSTGEMADLFWYNSGALMLALNPDQTLLNAQGESWIEGLDEDYRGTVSTPNGHYGAPVGSAMGGGFFYNIGIYEQLGLQVPLTWNDFLANGQAIRAAGLDPVVQTYGDTWTSQMLILSDYYNVHANDPEFANRLTANEVGFSSDPVALRSFEKLQQLAEAGSFNEDFASALLDQGLAELAEGRGAHYPMLTFAQATIEQNYPEQADGIGFFAVPGDSPQQNGLTTWMPSSVYAASTTEHPDEARRFLAFVASPAGCDAITEARGVTGPYVVDGCEISGDVSRIVSDMLPYFESDATTPALEFVSPVKGPNLQSITVEVGSGITPAAEGARAYDEDNALQAQQLGLEGW